MFALLGKVSFRSPEQLLHIGYELTTLLLAIYSSSKVLMYSSLTILKTSELDYINLTILVPSIGTALQQ